jgi:hypothetical protein
MEARQIPVVIFIMSFFVMAGFIMSKVDFADYSVPQFIIDFNEWMRWKTMPGW